MNHDESAERSATSRIRNMASRADPLIDWYTTNKPSCKVVRFTDEEYALLQKFSSIATGYGFSWSGGEIEYRRFTVLPTSRRSGDTSTQHEAKDNNG